MLWTLQVVARKVLKNNFQDVSVVKKDALFIGRKCQTSETGWCRHMESLKLGAEENLRVAPSLAVVL